MKAYVYVSLKKSVLDPQGKTIHEALGSMGYAGVADVRQGKFFVLELNGLSRATFLPQVWNTVPDPERFLSMLCQKLGTQPDAWRHEHFDVETYQVEEFSESAMRAEPDQP